MATFRVKCSSCKKVYDFSGADKCKCGAEISVGGENVGMIQLYRMGNFVGSATGWSIYIDKEPYGHIGNRQCIRLPLPYGTHLVHVVPPMSSRCNDPQITLTAEKPIVCLKGHLNMGFWANKVVLEEADPAEMPAD